MTKIKAYKHSEFFLKDLLAEEVKKMAKCVVCGYEDNEVSNRKYGNSIIYRHGEPICRACVEDNDLLLECGIKPSKIK